MAILEVGLEGRALSHARSNGFNLPEHWVTPEAGTGSVLVGFRPEDVQLAGGPRFSASASFKGRVDMVETLGHEVLIHIDLDGVTLIAKSFGHQPCPALGDSVEVEANLDKAHFFSVQSHQRLREKG
jgi:multiple sugar transport system ATP-binding protein